MTIVCLIENQTTYLYAFGFVIAQANTEECEIAEREDGKVEVSMKWADTPIGTFICDELEDNR